MKYHLLFSLSLLAFLSLKAQNTPRKQINALRTEGGIKIDGVIDEPEWLKAESATDFIQLEPNPGKPSPEKTDVRILYDNKAIYVAAYLYDKPDSILKELNLRDNLGNTDFFAVLLDTYKDGNNGFTFIVTPSGTQSDARNYAGGENGSQEDFTWNAVWKSEVKITPKGWVVEMEIPYSAIRFPNEKNQSWRINFGRQIRRIREKEFWNEVKPNVAGILNQSGEVTGITDIKSPFRLQAFPFFGAYVQNDREQVNGTTNSTWRHNFTGGMDIKYGINAAFTLDMTLIPDFGQVQSDNKVLNLSPFEVRFDENRQFFTEGVELFNKGRFFYSRRIGSISQYFFNKLNDRIGPKDSLISRPTEAFLYNATKVSGRTKSGLGVGILNALAAPTYAKIFNTEKDQERSEEVTPLTNYNVVSFDQNLPNNSYVTIINTNVLRNGTAYDANVTGLNFNLRDKKNTYALTGNGGLAQRHFKDSTDWSYKYNFSVAKVSGKWQWEAFQNLEAYNYNPNDLGFLRSPNENTWGLWGGYFNYEPKGKLNRWNVNGAIYNSNLQRPSVFNEFAIQAESFFLTKKIFAFGFNINLEPIRNHDYFEPRTSDFSQFLLVSKNYKLGGFISTDYRKTLAGDLQMSYRYFSDRNQGAVEFGVYPRIRFNDKISLFWSINVTNYDNFPNYISPRTNGIGYENLTKNTIVMGERKQLEIVNTPNLKWNFNSKMGINFRLRHYWTRVKYDQFFNLAPDGLLLASTYKGVTDKGENLHNTNFNLFNIDANFTWRFAPGSDVIVNWKNNIAGEDNDVAKNYFQNVSRLFDNPINNSLSVRFIYFLDYLNFTKSKPKTRA